MQTEFTYEELYDEEAYRDSLATVDKDGKRVWLYPKKPSGSFYNKRILATIGFLLVFFSVPFVKINGMPLLMMNFLERKFVIFGQLFLPQDFILFGIGMIIFVVFIILFTVTYGRIWCGWLCPQTVFMEMIFRPIENWLEGDGRKQRKFDSSAMTWDKFWRKAVKHAIYIAFSVLIAHVTMAYIIGVESVLNLVTSSPFNNPSGFIGVMVFTGLFYFVFSRLREQVCIAICPYGRLQGVLVNRDTMTIIYDFLRGEPRGKIKKTENEEAKGDCIDCGLCVQVCPTGIDIRNGIQLECVNCTACIDACDDVMEKINKPKGLIRYASTESVEKKVPFSFGKRNMAYSVVLLLLLTLEGVLLFNRQVIDTTVMRVPGQLYQKNENGTISNLYNAQIVNKSQNAANLSLETVGKKGTIHVIGSESNSFEVEAEGKKEVIFFLQIPAAELNKVKSEVQINVLQDGKVIEEIETNFMGPNK